VFAVRDIESFDDLEFFPDVVQPGYPFQVEVVVAVHVDVDFEVVADDVRELIPVLDKDAGFFFELALHCLQGKLVGLDFAADAVKQSGLPLRMVLFHENDVLLYEKQSYDVFFHVNTPWSRLCSG